MKQWNKIFHANGIHKKAGVSLLNSDKSNFRLHKEVKTEKGVYYHFLMLKVPIHQEEIILNILCTQYWSIQVNKENIKEEIYSIQQEEEI